MRERFPLTVNEKLVEIDDPIVDGRDIRGAAGFDPPSDYVLVLMGHRSAQSVGLDARLDLRELDKPSFRAWESDRLFEFTVNEHGFEWGGDRVSVEEVRRCADIDEDHELVLDADHDSVIPAGGSIDLSAKGVEHIVSRKRRLTGVIHLTFVVNGHPHGVAGAPSDTLLVVLEEALKEGENVGQAADCWEVRTEDGTQLDVGATLGALGLVDGTVLLANLKAGAAG